MARVADAKVIYRDSGSRAPPGFRSDPLARPWLELGGQIGMNAPWIREAGTGPSAGGVALLRPTSGFAFGFGAEVARFPWLEDTPIWSTTYGLKLRLYASIAAPWDGYLEFLVGYTQVKPAGIVLCAGDGATALGLALGVDRYLSQELRVGGLLGVTTAWDAMVCDLAPIPDSDRYIHGRSPGLGLRATATFGAG